MIEVIYQGIVAGKIILDSKDHLRWSNKSHKSSALINWPKAQILPYFRRLLFQQGKNKSIFKIMSSSAARLVFWRSLSF